MAITHQVAAEITQVYTKVDGKLCLIHAETTDHGEARTAVIASLAEQNIKHGAVMALVKK